MEYISRSRSRSVSTAPFTRATGLSLTRTADGGTAEVWGVFAFATAVGAWEATWADAAVSATRSTAQIESWYFIIPRLPILSKTESEKKRERNSLPPFIPLLFLLECRGDVVGVVSFVRFAKVALTAELRRRGRLVLGVGLKVHVVWGVHEEVRGIVASGIASDLAGCASRVHGHDVLVVAGGASNVGLASAVDAGWCRPLPRRQRGPTVVGYELSVRGACSYCEHAVGKDQAATGTDSGIQAHRVIVAVIAGRCSVIAEQGWDLATAVGGIRDQADHLFVRLVDHHVGRRGVAVMAAKAEQDAADFKVVTTGGNDAAGQNFDVLCAVAEPD